MAPWQQIKTEYITTDISYRKLAQKYGLRYATLQERATREGWPAAKTKHRADTVSKTVEKIGDRQAAQLARIDGITNRLLSKLERAVEELDITLATNTRKTKVIEYNNPQRADKPTKEIVDEVEQIVQTTTIVDRAGLRQLTAALKDLKEIQMIKSELDRREQEARIAKLQKEAEKQDNEKSSITITLEGSLSDYAQ